MTKTWWLTFCTTQYIAVNKLRDAIICPASICITEKPVRLGFDAINDVMAVTTVGKITGDRVVRN